MYVVLMIFTSFIENKGNDKRIYLLISVNPQCYFIVIFMQQFWLLGCEGLRKNRRNKSREKGTEGGNEAVWTELRLIWESVGEEGGKVAVVLSTQARCSFPGCWMARFLILMTPTPSHLPDWSDFFTRYFSYLLNSCHFFFLPNIWVIWSDKRNRVDG